jgi:hypothetical protein
MLLNYKMDHNVYTNPDAVQGVQLVGIIYNATYGGFGYSQQALDLYTQRSGRTIIEDEWSTIDPKRNDPLMVQIVKELGKKAGGQYARLKVVYVRPEHVNFIHIHEYDGLESITINWTQYMLYQIRHIVGAPLQSDDKIDQIKQLFGQYQSKN